MNRSFLLLMSLSIIACSHNVPEKNQTPSTKLTDLDRFVVYMEYPPKKSAWTNEADYIVLQQVDGGSKRYLIRDVFLNRSPSVSPGGKLVAFISAREGNPLRLRAIGDLAPRGIFGYDLVNNKLMKLVSNEVSNQIGRLELIEFAHRHRLLVCSGTPGNSLWLISLRKDSLEELCRLHEGSSINHLSISPNDKYVSLSYTTTEFLLNNELSVKAGLAIFNMRTKQIDYVQNYLGEIGGWVSGEKSFLVRDTSGTWGTFDFQSNKFSPMTLPKSLKDYSISELQFWDKDTLIFIGEEKRAGSKEGSEDVYLYALKENTLRPITSDGFTKTDLTFYNKFEK